MKSRKLLGFSLIILAIVIGVLSVTVENFSPFFPGWWALFIVFLGIAKLEHRGERLMGLLIIAGGSYIIFSANTNFDVDFYNVAIIFGLLLVGISLVKPKSYNNHFHYESTNQYTNNSSNQYTNTSTEYTSENNTEFKKESEKAESGKNSQSFSVVLGSRVYDLSGLDASVDNYITCECVLGELRVTLPRNMNVIIRDSNFLGEIRDYRTNAVNAYDHTLYLNCNCVLGQIAIN
ncbi:hypothetical protein RZE82_02310 [Mollicutes bacterium LVI A0039]|nr:hypothetical protein RZE82_02310 [Mollicutes bacterium LVI A0039]